MNLPAVGIHDLTFATTHYALELATLAQHRGIDPDKYLIGLGQEAMSIPAPDEDIVTMAASAAAPILERHGTTHPRTILFATETGVDQSKAAGLYLHPLLDLPRNIRVVELKQACYAGTAALQLAAALVTRNPTEQVLVIASDIAKYDLDSPGEPTQGAAAAAMLITANPAILRLDPPSGLYSTDIMDFWRPNYRTTALVDGKLSITAYLNSVTGAWTDYQRHGGLPLTDFTAFCYHQPFTKMAYKAHRHLLDHEGAQSNSDAIEADIGATTHYNRMIGNSYTASLYLALASLLDHTDDLTDRPVGLLSYGSGNVAEFFAGTVIQGYREHLRTAAHKDSITRRKPIDYEHYRAVHETQLGENNRLTEDTADPFRLAAVDEHKRIYEHRHSR
ncbi:hydroxymethylglutaryl-CoA synthase [Nocardia sp. JMUB6875]|uniref:hydroxymethylglutaryl-CoA synthase n=1 Tax=Nocardia sp. JMUB6875 TaxID=3158170 RepID=UPI0032E79B1C